ncbi:DUF4089 domain-containing protein [Rhodoferax sp.]|uniref:DUF4089 domain-containing protein n=1 Tax=Rhodoferax sp. TaxID=50421 RepID=UPI002719110C|nr:DUF4089 domain-containing protein [Rhodoferax sp.]MDO9199161.1 DUF4089 domain-containing protein [Rhodoferax sp.]
MTETEVPAYVKASASAQGLTLDDARAHRVATHLARCAHLAQLLDAAPLSPDHELAEIYKPLAFPPPSNKRYQL